MFAHSPPTKRSAKQKAHFRAVLISPGADNCLATRGQPVRICVMMNMSTFLEEQSFGSGGQRHTLVFLNLISIWCISIALMNIKDNNLDFLVLRKKENLLSSDSWSQYWMLSTSVSHLRALDSLECLIVDIYDNLTPIGTSQ